jgi:type IV pilus assembly protein PilY1
MYRTIELMLRGCGIAALIVAGSALAEDVELFRVNPELTGDKPNILIIIDNQSNWSASSEWPDEATKQERIQEAFLKVFLEMDDLVDRINVGILNVGSSHRQGKVIEGVRPFDAQRQSNSSFRNRIVNMDDNWWRSSNTDYGLLMNEAYKYFAALPASDGDANWRDQSIIDEFGNYVPPLGGACGGNYVIFIATGFPTNDYPLTNNRNSRDGIAWAPNHLVGYGGDGTIIPLNPNNYQESMADEYARFMASDRARTMIRTHVIDVFNPARSQEAQRVFWRSIAQQGKGEYQAAESAEDIVEALTKTFSRILAINSVFAASTLPVSVNVRGTHLNQVYMGVFRPDADFNPRWMGNLKLYKLAEDTGTGTVYFADRNDQPAQDGNFVRSDAISFWTTPGAAPGFWAFNPERYRNPYDEPDGEIVEKGGAAQQLRLQFTTALELALPVRPLLTCTGNCNQLRAFSSLNTGLDTALVDWVRGQDNYLPVERQLGGVRPSIHGDVLHSRPAVLNYSADPDDVVVFYGANDGVLRAIQGGPTHPQGGQELWGFVAPEFFDRLDNLRTNTPIDTMSGKPYFMDGGIGVYHEIEEDVVSKVWIFPTMRRGGRSIYAFDVSLPQSPSLMWRIQGGSGNFTELGQTWSEPRAVRTLANDGKPVLIFGAGYDGAAEDAVEPGARTMGRGIFVVDAATGNYLWSAGAPGTGAALEVEGMVYSIPSDPTVVRRSDFNRMNRIADRLYVGDTGGNVWRVDMGSADMQEWRVHKVAALGEAHKFLYAPDVVFGSSFDSILIGSGDREKPHDTESQNAFFMIKDRFNGAHIHEEIDTVTVDGLLDVTEQASSVDAIELLAYDGWILRFGPGEKAVGGSVTLAGTVYFSTHEPQALSGDPLSCSLGTARNYAVRYLDGTAPQGVRYVTVPGGGFVPSPVAVLVPVLSPDADPFDPGRLVEGVLRGTQFDESEGAQLLRRRRTFWFTETDG